MSRILILPSRLFGMGTLSIEIVDRWPRTQNPEEVSQWLGRPGFPLVLGVFSGCGSVTAVRHVARKALCIKISSFFHRRNGMLTILDKVVDSSCLSLI